jgi:hypothetical protein
MLIVSIISKRDEKTYFNRCGVGFKNKDGSINFKLDIHGDTQFHIREAQSDAAENERKEGGVRARG